MVVFCLLLGIFVLEKQTMEAQAASVDYKYEQLNLSYTSSKNRTKCGKYYFWIDWASEQSNARFMYSKTTKGKAYVLAKASKKDIVLDPYVVSNGKTLFYLEEYYNGQNVLCSATIGSKQKATYVKTTKTMNIVHAYGKDLYYTLHNKLYKMDVKKKKKKLVLSSVYVGGVLQSKDNGFCYYKKAGKDANKWYTYDCKAGKSRALGTTGLYGNSPYIYKDKIYFQAVKKSKSTIYSFSLSGKSKKTVKSNMNTDGGWYKSKYYCFYVGNQDENTKYYLLDLTKKKLKRVTENQFWKVAD